MDERQGKRLMDQIEALKLGREVAVTDPLDDLVRQLCSLRGESVAPDPAHKAVLRHRLLAGFEERYGQQIRLSLFDTALGWIGVAVSGRGIVALNLPRPTREAVLSDLRARWPKADLLSEGVLGGLADQLRHYAAGERVVFRTDLDLSHQTPFRQRVFEVTLRIPYGETRSYAWIARQIGKPRAYRAVGQALSANPIPIVMPCHRVVASDGDLRGYAGGLEMKRRLLALERGPRPDVARERCGL